jgi:hypothetical protein
MCCREQVLGYIYCPNKVAKRGVGVGYSDDCRKSMHGLLYFLLFHGNNVLGSAKMLLIETTKLLQKLQWAM